MKCKAITKKGVKCSRKAAKNGFCIQHSSIKQKSIIKRFWKQIIIVFTFLILVMDIFDFFDLGKPWNDYIVKPINNIVNKPKFKNTDAFNIAILPFYPNKDCTIENTNYESQLILRLKELDFYNSILTEVTLFNNIKCPFLDKDAISFARREKADLVIWGIYDEECDEENKIRIKYKLIGSGFIKGQNYFKSFGDSGMRKINSRENISSGHLQQDIEYLLYWIAANILLNRNRLSDAKHYVNKIKANPCNEAILNLKMGIRLNEAKLLSKESLAIVDSILNCNPKSVSGNFAKAELFILIAYELIIIEGKNMIIELQQELLDLGHNINPDEISKSRDTVELLTNQLQQKTNLDYISSNLKNNFLDSMELYYNKAVELDSTLIIYALKSKAMIYSSDKNFQKALINLNAAINISSEDSTLNNLKVNILNKIKNSERQ